MTPASYWKQVREAIAGATEGDWYRKGRFISRNLGSGMGMHIPGSDVAIAERSDDAAFIALSRTALPLALARIEELEAALECERPHKEHNNLCAFNFEEGPCDCAFGVINRRIDAALGK